MRIISAAQKQPKERSQTLDGCRPGNNHDKVSDKLRRWGFLVKSVANLHRIFTLDFGSALGPRSRLTHRFVQASLDVKPTASRTRTLEFNSNNLTASAS
jgi:hypothetical protein